MAPRSFVVSALLVATVALSASGCRSRSSDAAPGDPAGPAAEPAARPDTTQGRFAPMTKVGAQRWSIPGDVAAPKPDDGTGAAGGGAGGGGGEGKGGSKKFGPTSLFVDGQPLGVVSWFELPPWLPTTWVEVGEGADARKVSRFVLADYIETFGVDLDDVVAVHFFGGRGRVAVATGEQLRRVKDELYFSFTAGQVGKMRMHWRGDFAVSDSIDKVQAVQVYVAKRPPTWDRAKWSLVDDAGEKITGMPYATGDLRGGLRIYLDGRVVHVVKRGAVLGGDETPHRMDGKIPFFRLLDYLGDKGIDTRKVVALEVVAGDAIAARLDGAALRPRGAPIELSIPPKDEGSDRGKVVLHAGGATYDATAVLLYSARRASATHRRPGGAP